MFLDKLSLINFRNLENQELNFQNTVNVFYGNNAQGKTNLLEAINLISTGKSFRTRSDHELISWGKERCKIQGHVGFLDIGVTIVPDQKELLINNQKSRLVELLGNFIVVVFTPSDVEIVSGSPDKRRRFLDQLGATLDKKYLFNLVSLNRVLKNRNQTLWQIKNGRQADLSVWNEQLVRLAVNIWFSRASLIEKINAELKTLGRRLLKANLKIVYQLPFSEGDKKHFEKEYLNRLSKIETEEINKTITLIGPHRDDFNLIAEEIKQDKVVSKDLNIYGSHGEQRTAALALKLTEVNLIEKENKEKPVLLLDEVLSELDKNHREFLLKEIRGLQVFITTTSLESVSENLVGQFRKFEISEGKVIAR